MFKLLIACLLVLLTVNAQSFEGADTGSYKGADFDQYILCIDEVDAQYKDSDGLIDYTDITSDDIDDMEAECKIYN